MEVLLPGSSALLLYMVIEFGQLFASIESVVAFSGCVNSPCKQGLCMLNDGTFLCICSSNWVGEYCDTFFQNLACISNPCHNSGTCLPYGTVDYRCQCTDQWYGQNCAQYRDSKPESTENRLPSNARHTMDYTGIVVMIGILGFLAFFVFIYTYLPKFRPARYHRTDRFVNYLHNFTLDTTLRPNVNVDSSSGSSTSQSQQLPLNGEQVHLPSSSGERSLLHTGSTISNCTCRSVLPGPLFCQCLESHRQQCQVALPARTTFVSLACQPHPPLRNTDSFRSDTTSSDGGVEPPPSYFDVILGGVGIKVGSRNGHETPPPAYEDL